MLSAYFLHKILALLFILVIPLPFVTLVKLRKQTELRSIWIWRTIILVNNVGLGAVLITGIIVYPIFSSIRFWLAIVLTLALGGLLGVISKQLKHYTKESKPSLQLKHLRRITIIGLFYIALIVVIFGFMAHWYQF